MGAIIINLSVIERGDDVTFPLEFTDKDGGKINITTWKIYFTLRETIPDTEEVDVGGRYQDQWEHARRKIRGQQEDRGEAH